MNLKHTFETLPSWILTIVVSLTILYLTLAPHPLPDDTPEFFPGADKVVHGLMFGGLTLVILIDTQRKGASARIKRLNPGSRVQAWQPLGRGYVWKVASLSALAGIVIECLQYVMGLGRGFEVADIIADTVGSFLFAALWLLFQNRWSTPPDGTIHGNGK